MPTYKNTSTAPIYFEGRNIAPGESLAVMRCYPAVSLPSGITRTSIVPIWNPVIISQIVTGDDQDVTTITIPATKDNLPVEDFDILISGIAGSAEVRFNDGTDFTPPLLVETGASTPVNPRPFGVVNRAVESIIVKCTAATSRIKVDVLKK